jgi:large subunit ribosomal protein L19
VRKIVDGVAVERILPILSPIIDKIEVVQFGVVRRARLFYLRNLKGKNARVKQKFIKKENIAAEA